MNYTFLDHGWYYIKCYCGDCDDCDDCVEDRILEGCQWVFAGEYLL